MLGEWTEQLESTIVNLALALEDHVQPIIAQMGLAIRQMAFGSTSLEDMMATLVKDIASAVEHHDRLSVGRLHQTLYSLVEMKLMFAFPPPLLQAISDFERVKCSLTVAGSLHKQLTEVVNSLDIYVLNLIQIENISVHDGYIAHLGRTKQACQGTLLKATTAAATTTATHAAGASSSSSPAFIPAAAGVAVTDLSLLWGLKSAQSMYHMSMNMFAPSGGQEGLNPLRASSWPVLPVHLFKELSLASVNTLDGLLDHYTETLSGDVLMCGSVLAYKLGLDLEQDTKVLQNLLLCGLGYVCCEGRLIALHSLHHACLFLTPPPAAAVQTPSSSSSSASSSPSLTTPSPGKPAKTMPFIVPHRNLHKRAQDVARVLRNGNRELKLSLRINTNFDLAVSKLKQHHPQSWISEPLEKTWRYMFDRLQLIIVELWCVFIFIVVVIVFFFVFGFRGSVLFSVLSSFDLSSFNLSFVSLSLSLSLQVW